MDEKFRRTASRQITITDADEEDIPLGAVRVVEAPRKERPAEKLAPMPQPRLDPNDGTRLFVPSDINRQMNEKKPASGAPSAPVASAPAAAAQPRAELPKLDAALNKDAAVDPIFPQSNDIRQVRRVPKDERGFDLKKVFIDFEETEKPAPREHAPLPPEVPLGGTAQAAGSRVATPEPSVRRSAQADATSPAAESSKTVFRQADAPRPKNSRKRSWNSMRTRYRSFIRRKVDANEYDQLEIYCNSSGRIEFYQSR